MDKRAKSVSNERASDGENDISEIIENLEESEDEDNIEGDDNSEVEDEFESTNLKKKTVSCTTAIWEHYKPRLLTTGASIAYLCSPHPAIIAHSEANKYPLNNIAIEEFIRRVILPRRQTMSENPNVVLAKLVDMFWAERDDFVKQRGFFSRESIWITAGDPMTISYKWHKRYSVPASEVFCLSACLSFSLVLGCGQAEQQWKATKAQKTGKHTNLGSEKTKKQSVICTAFARQKSET